MSDAGADEPGTAGPGTVRTDATPAGPGAHRAVFRAVPLPALVAVGFVAMCVSPIGFLGGAWFLVFVVPVALAWWLVRTCTIVDGAAVRVRSAWGSQRIPWDDVTSLRIVERGWVRAVRPDGSEPALRGVRTRDLGRVALASGGRITMPTPEEVEDAIAHQRELEATRMRIAALREAREGDADSAPGDGAGRA